MITHEKNNLKEGEKGVVFLKNRAYWCVYMDTHDRHGRQGMNTRRGTWEQKRKPDTNPQRWTETTKTRTEQGNLENSRSRINSRLTNEH